MRRREKRVSKVLVMVLLAALTGNCSTALAQTARVKPYKVSPTLREVVNLRPFSRAFPLSLQQRRALTANLFTVSPTNARQLFHVYEENDYKDIPSFVTTDSVLHLYHIFYDFTLRTVEERTLMPVLARFTQGMLKEAVATWKETNDPQLKEAALKNVAYFGVAARLLGLQADAPAEAANMLAHELGLVERHEGFKVGAIFPYTIDYSQFIPRGHYTRGEILPKYFRAMMWYGLVPFALRTNEGRSDETLRQSLLLVRSLYRARLEADWETIYEPTSFFVGAADDLTPAEWRQLMTQIFGADLSLSEFANTTKFDAFFEAAQKLRPPRIQFRTRVQPNQPNFPDPSVQLRLMGQRYIPDSEIMQRLSFPVERVFPSGLDVMAVMGSPRALEILDTYADVYNRKKWAGYLPERAELLKEFAALPAEKWESNLYWGWLNALRALTEPVPEGYPSFMRNAAWADKSVHTALASWAELRHDTILYGKQSGAEQGDGSEPAAYKGYVEPNFIFWNRLLRLTVASREGLTRRNLLPDELKDKFEQFETLLATLKRISEKELRGERLTEDEYEEIRHIGGTLEYMTLSVMTGNPDTWEMVNETDKDMAVVADVHTGGDSVLEEGVGHAYEILVIVPVEGRLVLTRGAALSYYEFEHPASTRLTDEAWQKMVNDGRTPAPPIWTKTFLTQGKPRPVRQ